MLQPKGYREDNNTVVWIEVDPMFFKKTYGGGYILCIEKL
jgi:hypothetical protein